MLNVTYSVGFKDGVIQDYCDSGATDQLKPVTDAETFSGGGWQVKVDRTADSTIARVVCIGDKFYHIIFAGTLTGTLLLGTDKDRPRAVFIKDDGENEQYLIDKYGINNFDHSGTNDEYEYNWQTDTRVSTWDYTVLVSDGRVDTTMKSTDITYRVDGATWAITVSHRNNGVGPSYVVTLHAEEVTDDVVKSVDKFFHDNELCNATYIARNWQEFVKHQNSKGE